MSKHRVVVLKILAGQLTVSAAAVEYGMSRRHLHRLLARYRDQGLAGLEPRSRRPRSNPRRTPMVVAERIVALRTELTSQGLDAGPVTIGWHLAREQLPVPSTSTIRRILATAGLVTPAPRKRPKTSYLRFEAAQPNQCWQSDFTHWRLANGTEVEILNWLDDHSRYLLGCTVHPRVTGDDVAYQFCRLIDEFGPSASTLTDNGVVFTARFVGGRNVFEALLATLAIQQKNGHPGHPQTQGKIGRFHQTLKRWLTAHPTAATLAQLQAELDRFRDHYNQHRPHRALDRTTPATAYHATPKAHPPGHPSNAHYRIRYDRVDKTGAITLRHHSRLHHLAIGARHTGTRVIALIDPTSVTVTRIDTGEIIATHTIDPDHDYWRNTQRAPGRWPRTLQ